MSAAETVTRALGCTMISVISGVGVRDYYENLGYSLDTNEDQYMVKRLAKEKKDMRLFGKIYNSDHIHKSIRSSIIVQKYILKNTSGSISNISSTSSILNTHVYDGVQNGEAQGFEFEGCDTANTSSKEMYLSIIISVLYALYVFYLFYLSFTGVDKS